MLRLVRKGQKVADALQEVDVDRVTVRATASIAEFAIAAPEEYRAMERARDREETLLQFAERCQTAIENRESLKEKIMELREEKKLLEITKKAKN